MEIVRYVLIVCGLIYAVTQSAIFSPIRLFVARRLGGTLRMLIYCPACSGFWIGLMAVRFLPWQTGAVWQSMLESAVCAMALGALWSVVVESSVVHAEIAQLRAENVLGE